MLFQELLNQVAASNHDFYSPDYGNGTQGSKCLSFNGDDAITLEKTSNGSTYGIVDIFGLIGERPQTSTGGTGAGWTDEPKYWNGIGAYWTKDQTLIRKSTVNTGVTSNPGPPYQSPGYFNPSTQWDSLSVNTFDSLGTHTCDCSANSGIKENDLQASISIYPNPVFGHNINIVSIKLIDHAEIFDLSGKLLKSFSINTFKSSLSLEGLNKGAYLLKISLEDQTTISKNLIIQ
ncbi:MAG TPA: T9SS type A sorting domain-containing protein [Bacteroidetes bacterium]|nr:T9SS type A sorting domain-containing protein [Bacteroidota bacterium]